MYVIVTPLPPSDGSEKQEETPVAVLADEKKDAPVEATPKDEAKPVDDGGVMDLSGAFDLATVLANNFEFSMRRLHVRVEGNPASPIPLFSLGIAIEDMKLDTIVPSEAVCESHLRKSFRMDGFSLYWCINDKVLIAEASPEVRIAGMRGFFGTSGTSGTNGTSPIAYDKNDRLLDDLHLQVRMVGDLRKIEDRMRSAEDCLKLTAKDCNMRETDAVDALILSRLKGVEKAELALTRP